MGFEAQHIKAPDGTAMVVLRTEDYERLLALADDGSDRIAGETTLARIEGGEGTMPSAVLDLILDEGLHPIAAWRRYRGLSRAELARSSGLSEVWIGRIEAGGGHGTGNTRARIANALDAPVWTIETEAGSNGKASGARSPKYAPLAAWLAANGADRITLPFDDIDRIVGSLPKSARDYQPWWQNNRGHSQALGWRDAGYLAKPDMKRGTVVFVKENRP